MTAISQLKQSLYVGSLFVLTSRKPQAKEGWAPLIITTPTPPAKII